MIAPLKKKLFRLQQWIHNTVTKMACPFKHERLFTKFTKRTEDCCREK